MKARPSWTEAINARNAHLCRRARVGSPTDESRLGVTESRSLRRSTVQRTELPVCLGSFEGRPSDPPFETKARAGNLLGGSPCSVLERAHRRLTILRMDEAKIEPRVSRVGHRILRVTSADPSHVYRDASLLVRKSLCAIDEPRERPDGIDTIGMIRPRMRRPAERVSDHGRRPLALRNDGISLSASFKDERRAGAV